MQSLAIYDFEVDAIRVTKVLSLPDSALNLVARAIRNAICANRFARIIRK